MSDCVSAASAQDTSSTDAFTRMLQSTHCKLELNQQQKSTYSASALHRMLEIRTPYRWDINTPAPRTAPMKIEFDPDIIKKVQSQLMCRVFAMGPNSSSQETLPPEYNPPQQQQQWPTRDALKLVTIRTVKLGISLHEVTLSNGRRVICIQSKSPGSAGAGADSEANNCVLRLLSVGDELVSINHIDITARSANSSTSRMESKAVFPSNFQDIIGVIKEIPRPLLLGFALSDLSY